MKLLGVVVGFTVILILNSREVNMGLALFTGAVIAGLISPLTIPKITKVIVREITDPLALQLMVIVTVVSGLGYVLKETGDLDQMIDALIAIFRDGRVLSMLLPALIGTLAVPGGAILSAPMIDNSGDRIKLDQARKTAINLFFRHIFLFAYPLFGGIILTSKLFGLAKVTIIKYNLIVMVIGSITAYFVFFKREHQEEAKQKTVRQISSQLKEFIIGFLPILTIIILAIGVQIPFYLAVIIGLLVAVGKNLSGANLITAYINRLKKFFQEGAKYKMIGLIIGVMSFKGIVEASGAVDSIAQLLSTTAIPLSLMIISLGLITGYLSGMTMAALGILIPIFKPLFPAGAVGPYVTLLFTATFVGYLVSPIHLCLALTKEYFEVSLQSVYRLMVIPGIVMIAAALLQVIIL